jgi:hypothetical protein
MTDLATAMAECLAAHAEAVDQFGTDHPELLDGVPANLREKLQRQRGKVSATLEGVDPAVHAVHVEALAKGLRLVLRRLGNAREAR